MELFSMTLELTITLILALCLSAGRAHGQAGMLLDPTVGPQPATGFRVAVATAPITADFSFSPSSGAWPLTVQFVDLTQGGPGSWAWNFGDGGTSISQNPVHTFNSANTFTVSLTATGPGGSSATNHSITVTNSPTWAIGFGSTGSDEGNVVQVDSSGNIIVAGYFQGTVNFGTGPLTSAGGVDLFLAKYSSTRACVWSKSFGSTGDEIVRAIALDGSGNIFLGGQFTGTANVGGTNFTSAGQNDIFLAKYDSSGNHLWSRGFGKQYTEYINGLAVDSQGNVVATGSFQADFGNGIDFGGNTLFSNSGIDSFLAKYSSAGSNMWVKNFTNDGEDRGISVAVASGDNIVLAGYFTADINFGGGLRLTPGGYLVKVSGAGAYIWDHVFGTNNAARVWGMAMDSSGDIVVTGDFHSHTDLGGGQATGTSLNLDSFAAKYSGVDGNYVWSAITSGTDFESPLWITTDSANNVLVTGYFHGTATFAGQSLTTSPSASPDGFVYKYSGTGTPVWAQKFGGPSWDQGSSISVGSSGNPVITGTFSAAGTFFGTALTNAGGFDVFVARISP